VLFIAGGCLMAKKKKGKGFFSAIGSALGSIPLVAKVKKATKTVKKKVQTAKKQLKKTVKKVKKKVKKKVGKVYTKARKIKNNLSKSKIVKKVKRAVKKAVLSTKKAVKKAKAVVSKAKQKVKTVVKQTKKVMKEKVLPVVKKAAKATTKVVINAVKPKNLLDTIQLGLDIVGLIPIFGEVADLANGIIYLARGDKVNAALSFAAMIPVVGMAATAGKVVNKGVNAAKGIIAGVQKTSKGLVDRATEIVKKQVANVKTQIKSKVAEVKQQLRGKNKPTSSQKPSNSQPPQKGSNNKPDEANRGTDKVINEADRVKLNNWIYKPDNDLYLKYKDVFDNPKYYNQDTGEINWPKNDGFLTTPIDVTLKPGFKIDRYGYDTGTFVSPESTPYGMRAVAPGTDSRPFSVFEVVAPLEVKGGKIAPWFDEVGGGTQYVLPETVEDLLEAGIIRRITP
jgi:hypothetical protein